MGDERIGRDGVLKVARLARLELDEHEVAAMTRDLGAILDAFSSLAAVPLEATGERAEHVPRGTPLRPDVPVTPARRSDVFAAAPATRDGGFQVPKVVDK